MQGAERKAAITAYKERKTVAGVYALRCPAAGGIWVGRAADVATIENRLRFTLAHDAALRPSLKAAVRDHGADAVAFEVLERFGEDDIPYARDTFLRERQDHWRAQLGAEPI